MGWVSLILSPEGEILLQQPNTGFVTHSPKSWSYGGGDFKSPALPLSMFLTQSLVGPA